MSVLTKEQQDYLKGERKKITDLRLLVIEKYTPAIFENIKEIRETVRNLSITSGAIAALSISLLDKGVIKNQPLSFFSVSIFLFVVWEGFFYLKFILERENNQLGKRTESLHNAITKVRNQIDLGLKRNSQEEAVKFLEAFKELEGVISQDDKKVDNWFVKNIGDLTLIPFTFACILIVMSFINLTPFLILLFFLVFLLFALLLVCSERHR